MAVYREDGRPKRHTTRTMKPRRLLNQHAYGIGWRTGGSCLKALSMAGEREDDVHVAAGVPMVPTRVSALFHLAAGLNLRKMKVRKSQKTT